MRKIACELNLDESTSTLTVWAASMKARFIAASSGDSMPMPAGEMPCTPRNAARTVMSSKLPGAGRLTEVIFLKSTMPGSR